MQWRIKLDKEKSLLVFGLGTEFELDAEHDVIWYRVDPSLGASLRVDCNTAIAEFMKNVDG